MSAASERVNTANDSGGNFRSNRLAQPSAMQGQLTTNAVARIFVARRCTQTDRSGHSTGSTSRNRIGVRRDDKVPRERVRGKERPEVVIYVLRPLPIPVP